MAKIFALTEASSIALHSMVIIAKSKETLNVVKISEVIGSSKHHVAKVLQRLVKDDLLDSFRGPFGGFILKKEPKSITLLEVYESIEGRIEIATCPVDKKICPFKKCIIDNIGNQMTIDFRDYLKNQTLDLYM
ncbi:MAG: Rrf2 family transcriptional regulator [Bacteroidetes bacterium GWA2_30_7]|nr:MAG: Rrf2 family transcriptional regulator [Bacteroidetes bacterium GWA2_30_7]